MLGIVVVALALAAAVVWLPEGDAGHNLTSSPGEPDREASPPLGPGQPTTGYTGHGMDDTRLYNVMWANGSQTCAPLPGGMQTPPLPDDQLAAHLEEIIDCLVEVHTEPLAVEGLEVTTPTIVTYRDAYETPCGALTSENPAYYCSGNQTIYVLYGSDENRDGYARAELGYWILMAHEFGHHLQAITGIFTDYGQLTDEATGDERLQLSRRLELQATCFSGVFLGATRTHLGFDGSYYAARDFYRFNSDDQTGAGTHGTGQSQATWFDTGYRKEWNAFARCDTWAAEAVEVS